MANLHPCQSCGACCAYFRVEFYWREAVPEELCADLTPMKKVMRVTEAKHNPSCVALKGRVGEHVACGIYDQRSTPCRDFQASYEFGRNNPRCDEARAKHGLSPLRREDWPGPAPELTSES